jgi:Tfp pilus assembly protein PilX
MKSYNTYFNTEQQGVATLLVVLVLLAIMALVTLTTTRSGIMEQQIVGNDIRAREAQEAAEAGLEYGIAWASEKRIDWLTGITTAGITTLICPDPLGVADCPILATVSGTTSSETYAYTLTFIKGADSIRVKSVSQGVTDNEISATSEAFIKQIHFQLFNNDPAAKIPEPWVLSGCMTAAPTEISSTFVLNASNKAVISGTDSSAACLPQGSLNISEWSDSNGNGIKDFAEEGVSTTFNRDSFIGCPGTNCAWNYVFDMSLADAKQAATDAGHVFNSIPCGASDSPAIYIINNSGTIDGSDISGSCSGSGVNSSTVGLPDKPIVLIIPTASGCPAFNGGITVYGIVYYESTTACAFNGWGGAKIYGSVIWEGDVKKPDVNSEFIETYYGTGDELNDKFQMGVDDATRIPGTWKDF